MTYNFDPDKWYDMERSLLDKRLREGRIDAKTFEKQLDALDRRYDEMLNRLDGSYQIPK
jgi:hypothetical protein